MAKKPASSSPASHPAHPQPDLPQATWDAIRAAIATTPSPGFVAASKACRAARRDGRIQNCSNQQLDVALKYLADAGELGQADDSKPEPSIAPASDPLKIHVNRFLDVMYDEQAGRARVLVDGKLFLHCAFVVANIDPYAHDDNRNGSNITSIDDLAASIAHDARVLEGNTIRTYLTPAEEVLAHASNLQAWVENDYDTRLLHSNIAFPLLKQLVRAGDEKARRVLDAEIEIRIHDGNLNTRAVMLDTVIDYIHDPELLKILLEDEVLIQLDEEKSKFGEVRSVYYITRALERLIHDGNVRAINIRDELLASLLKDGPIITKAAILETWGELIDDLGIFIKLLRDIEANPGYSILDNGVLAGEILEVFYRQALNGRVCVDIYRDCLVLCLLSKNEVTSSTAYGDIVRIIREANACETNQFKEIINYLVTDPDPVIVANVTSALAQFNQI